MNYQFDKDKISQHIVKYGVDTRPPLAQVLLLPIVASAVGMVLYWQLTGRLDKISGLRMLKQALYAPRKKTPGIERVSLKEQLKLFTKLV